MTATTIQRRRRRKRFESGEKVKGKSNERRISEMSFGDES